MRSDQPFLNDYFSNIWRYRGNSLHKYHHSGYALIDKINVGERVLDVGCGTNPFRGRIPNLVGVDPAFDEADYKMTIEEFAAMNPHKFNVAFCLGSINFGDINKIEQQIACVVKLLRPQNSRIYWRCNPGLADHGVPECEEIDFFPWTFDDHARLASYFGFDVAGMDWDNENRIYAEWITKNRTVE